MSNKAIIDFLLEVFEYKLVDEWEQHINKSLPLYIVNNLIGLMSRCFNYIIVSYPNCSQKNIKKTLELN